jgi:hypothetical protein
MCAVTGAVRDALAGRDVPVIDPTLAAVGNVVAQALQGAHHSSAAYALPAWRAQEVA